MNIGAIVKGLTIWMLPALVILEQSLRLLGGTKVASHCGCLELSPPTLTS